MLLRTLEYLKRLHHFLMVLLTGLFTAFVVVIAITAVRISKTEIPHHLGNSPENIAYIKGHTDANDFTFAVVGDVKSGTATFEALLDTVAGDRPAFVIVLGDFVSHPVMLSHKLFAMEMAEHIRNFPILLIPGNHDISEKAGFDIGDFRKVYSRDQFSFTLGRYLFIFLNNVSTCNLPDGYLNFLEQCLSTHHGDIERTFVFMHIPPSGLDASLMCNTLVGSRRFLELCDRYKIDYVFAGDHHGYAKIVKKDTTFIITGGGGAKLRGNHGRFHHLVRVAVNSNGITQTVLAVPRQLETFELMERNIAAYLCPFVSENPVLSFGLLCFIAYIFTKRRVANQKN